MNIIQSNYSEILDAVKTIKNAVLVSRYNAARLANREQLSLYYNVGEYISTHSRTAKWGSGAVAQISQLLQKELPGLRGFSESGIKRMRTFYEGWSKYISNRPTALGDSANHPEIEYIANRPMVLDDFSAEETELFMSIGFSHHYDILIKTQSLQERLYYIRKCATENNCAINSKPEITKENKSQPPPSPPPSPTRTCEAGHSIPSKMNISLISSTWKTPTLSTSAYLNNKLCTTSRISSSLLARISPIWEISIVLWWEKRSFSSTFCFFTED